MNTYNTLNPLGSTDPRDLFDNSHNLDFAMNDIARAIWVDRFGRNRKTYWGMEQAFSAQLLSQKQRFDLFIQNSGYEVIGDYVDGPLTITEYNQLIRYDNELWKLTAATDIPFTTAGNDATSWASDKAHFVSVGDGALRQELASSAGASMVITEQGVSVQDVVDDILSPAQAPKLQHKLIHDVDYNSQFDGASSLSQGFCIVETPSGTRMFFHQPITATGKMRIVETEFDPGGNNSNPTVISYSQELSDVGHQSIGGVYDAGQVTLYLISADKKGYYKVAWNGASTSDASMTKVTVLTGSFYPDDTIVVLALSQDCKTLFLCAPGQDENAYYRPDDKRVIYFFDLVTGVFQRRLVIPKANYVADAFQGFAADDHFLYLLHGYTGVFLSQHVDVFTVDGVFIRSIKMDGVRCKYGRSGMMGNASLGYPVLQEPEGISLYGGLLYVMSADFWDTAPQLVTFAGKTFATRTNIPFSNISPVNPSYWTPTTHNTASALPYNKATTYASSGTGKRTKAVFSIELYDGTGYPVDSNVAFDDSYASLFLNNNSINIAIGRDEGLQVAVFDPNLQSYRPLIEIASEDPNGPDSAVSFKLFGDAFGDDVPSNRSVGWKHRKNATRDALEVRSDDDLLKGAGINLYSNSSPTSPGRLNLYCTDGTTTQTIGFSPTAFNPFADGVISLGLDANAWSDVRARRATFKMPGTGQPQVRTVNDLKSGMMQVSNAGNYGLFDDSAAKWLIASKTDGTAFMQMPTNIAGDFTPSVTNTYNQGSPTIGWKNGYFNNAITTISDAEMKGEVRDSSSPENAAFAEIARLPSVWQWLHRIEEEGDEARLHSGPTVQAAISVMDRHGLDWRAYSAFCYDKWDAQEAEFETVPAEYVDIPLEPAIYSEDGALQSPMVKSLVREEYEIQIKPAIAAGEQYRFRKEELLWWCLRATVSQVDTLMDRFETMEDRMAKLEDNA